MILDRIVENKVKEVEEGKKRFPLNKLKSKIKKSDRDFKKAIEKRLSLIAEVKKASPSKGTIRKNFNIKKIIRIYDKYADAISVLTDRKFFSGDINNIMKIKKLTDKPILRKDFIIDEYQIYESRYYGADAVLLIASVLSKKEIDNFIKIAGRYNMSCLVEVHTGEELKKVLKTKAEIIGVNNRNLDTLKIDMGTTLKLTKKIPENKIIVSESGFQSRKDIEKIKDKTNAVLIGTSILKSRNVEGKIKELILPKIKICGITNEKDALDAVKLGADYLGFIFYEKSPRFVDYKKVKKIIKKIPNAKRIGVFVNEQLNEIKKIDDECNFDLIQLSGNESNQYCEKLKKTINKKIIKAVHIKNKKDFKMSEIARNKKAISEHAQEHATKAVLDKTKNYKADYFLFDTYDKGKFGGTGKTFNHELVKSINADFFLSGGLNPGNIEKALKKIRPYAVDVCSGVEKIPGKKDISKMKLFFQRLR